MSEPPRLRALLAAPLLAIAAAPASAGADVRPLRVVPAWDATATGAAAALAIVLSSRLAAPTHCEVCGYGEFDETVRDHLVWSDPRPALHASDLLANVVLPAGALLNSALSSWRGGAPSAFFTDAMILAEVMAVSTALDAVSKDAVARRRPTAGPTARGAADESFYSGHTSLAFALAAGAGTVSTLRGYPSAPWVWGGGMALATGVGYLRIAGDAHWATDVFAGAAAGSAVGFGVPWLFHRVHPAHGRLDLEPAPGGVALHF